MFQEGSLLARTAPGPGVASQATGWRSATSARGRRGGSQRDFRRRGLVVGVGLWLLVAPGGAGGWPPSELGQTGDARDDRVEATRLLRGFVTQAPFECLLVLRASKRSPSEVLLFVCEEDDIHLPDIRGFVASFRIGLAPTDEVSIDVVHNHPDRLLIRTHSSAAASYSERRRALGLHSLAEAVVVRQIRLMRSGELPSAALPPSIDDLVTALKMLWLSEPQRVDIDFYIPDIGGRWRLQKSAKGWGTRKYVIKRLLANDRLYSMLRGTVAPSNQLEEHYAELFREFYVLRNRVAQVFSQEAFGRFEEGDRRGVEEERLRTERWLLRLREVALRLGVVLEFEPDAGLGARPAAPLGGRPSRVAARD